MPMAESPETSLLVSSVLNSFMSCFTMGYQMSAFNEPVGILMDFVNRSYDVHHGGFVKNRIFLASLWGFIIATFLIGQFFGSLFVPFFGDKYGRKTSMMIHTNIGFVIGSILLMISKPLNSFECLIFGRLIVGFCSGLGGGLLAMYLSECSPDRFRGMIGNMQNLFVTTATFMGSFLALHYALGTEELWPYLLGLPGILSLLQIIISPAFPESPKYLYLQQNDRIAAESSLIYYHGPETNSLDIFEALDNEHSMHRREMNLIEILRSNNLRWSALLSFIIPAASMLTGIMAIFSYSTQIFNTIGVSNSLSQWTTVFMSGFNTIGALLAIPALNRFGRRTLVLWGGLGTLICNIAFLVTDQLGYQYQVKEISYLSLVCMIVHVTIFNMSIGPVGWFYSSEISPQSARSTCASISLASNSIFALIQNIALPLLLESIGSYSFLLMIIPSVFLLLFLWKYMPETKDKSIDQILKSWWQDESGTSLTSETAALLADEDDQDNIEQC